MPRIWPFRKEVVEPSPDWWPVFPESIAPVHSCANCAWLRQSYVDTTGQFYARAQEVTEYERWYGLKYHDPALWKGKFFSWPECEVRGKDLSSEVQAVVGKPWNFDWEGYKEVVRRDRSPGSEFYCERFYPWNPRYSFEQHWEERKVLLLDESNKKHAREINDAANSTQRFIGLCALVAVVVAIVVPVSVSRCTNTIEIKGTVPVAVATPVVVPTVSP